MNPEEKALLENTHQLAKENNEMIQSLLRRAKFSIILKVFYWTVIIAISLGAVYLVQPYIDFVSGLTGGSSQTEKIPNEYSQQLLDLLK